MRNLPGRIAVAQALALLAALAVVIPAEIDHWSSPRDPAEAFFINVDTTLPLALFLICPYFWFVRRPIWSSSPRWWISLKAWWSSGSEERVVPSRFTLGAMILIAVTSFAVVARVSEQTIRPHDASVLRELYFDRDEYRFGELPPAYHDEYSYLFQAETYLAGRLSFPSHPTAARLFDQMHVVNEGRFASRYFPATGLFIAPWLWLGWPILGHWLAGAATAVLVFGVGRELSNNGIGFVAGLLTALSPGMGLFGNLLLAHHPTLLGLFFFAWSFLRWLRTGMIRDVAFAGIGLSWAMLCRPMTAAGFALPFGIWFAVRLWRLAFGNREASGPLSLTLSPDAGARARGPDMRRAVECRPDSRRAVARQSLLAMVVPLLVGFIVLGMQNVAITGRVMTSPYQLFTDIYSPRHVYGFHNVERGQTQPRRDVFANYDDWAEDLTSALAVTNAKNRLIASWQWTVGIVPLLAGSVFFLLTTNSRDRRWWMICASIVSLFAVHVPYWFDGMFHWHYVFETGPLWCLVLAAATDTLCRNWLSNERPRMPVWWAAMIGAAVLVNHLELSPFWYPSRLAAHVAQASFSRLRYQNLNERLQREVRQCPALVLIEANPADQHIDYVVNEPSLSADVIRGRYPLAEWPLERIVAEFPNRAVYLFRAKTGEMRRIQRTESKPRP